jgi:hypothetical protein
VQRRTRDAKGGAVESFSLWPRGWRVGVIVSRNPLVRWWDRLEALAIVVAVAISMLALPVVASMATELYHAQRAIYTEQARSRPPAPTEATESTAALAEGAAQLPIVETPQYVQNKLVVDDAGNAVSVPIVPSQAAAYDAVSVAVVIEGVVVGTMVALVVATRWHMGRVRDAYWDHDLALVLDDYRGRSHGAGDG